VVKNQRILAVVPARGGSKGIKLKNIFPLCGKPLICYTAEVIHQLKYIDKAIVSTDNEKIAMIAESCGLEVPFYRPQSLSGDFVGDWEVLHHALSETEKMDKLIYDIVLMLQPTSPLRKPEYVTETIHSLIDNDYDAVWTVSPTDSKAHPVKQLIINNELLDYYDPEGAKIVARQQLTKVYHRNGVAYAVKRRCIIEKKSIKGDKTGAVVINRPVSNIDTEMDILFTEYLLSVSQKS